MLIGLSLHFLLLLKKSTNGFFSVLMITPVWALSKGLNKLIPWYDRTKIEDQVNQIAHFYQGNLLKEKTKSR